MLGENTGTKNARERMSIDANIEYSPEQTIIWRGYVWSYRQIMCYKRLAEQAGENIQEFLIRLIKIQENNKKLGHSCILIKADKGAKGRS